MFNRREPFEGAYEKYLKRLPIIREVARLHGYAIAVHGSQKRDFDLIAVPWVEDASDWEALLPDLVVACEGVLQQDDCPPKPHGIQAFNIMIGGHLYIDLKIVPLRHHDERLVKNDGRK
jgi:hypothetical protein